MGSSGDEVATAKDLEGKQDVIDASHKLSSDLVDDSSCENLFVTSSEKSEWGGKSTVVANPSGSDGNDLSRIAINGTNYKIPSGSTVAANPSGNDGSNLTRIAIDGTNYNIPSGGSSSDSVRRVCVSEYDIRNLNLNKIQHDWNGGSLTFTQHVDWPGIIHYVFERYSAAISQDFEIEEGSEMWINIGPKIDSTETLAGVIYNETSFTYTDGEWDAESETTSFSIPPTSGEDYRVENVLNSIAIHISVDSGVQNNYEMIYPLDDGALNEYITVTQVL